jgi:hypothetical protein
MVISESWVDGRRKRAVLRTGATGDTSAPEPQTEVIETELRLVVAAKIPKPAKGNSKERKKAKRSLERQMEALRRERLRRLNGL